MTASGEGRTETDALIVRCELTVFSSSLAADEVAERVGLQPSRSRSRGEIVRPGGPRVPTHIWTWRPALDVPDALDAQLDAIARAVDGRTDTFRALEPVARVTVGIIIEHHGIDLTLGWVLDDRHVALAASLGASIDIDEYDYTER